MVGGLKEKMERLHKLARRRRLPASQGGFVYICGTCEEPLQGRKQMTRHLMEDHEEEFTQFRKDFKGSKQSDKDFESQISKMMISVNFEPYNEETAKNTLEQVIDMSKQNGNGEAASKNGSAEVVTLEKEKDPIFEDPALAGVKRPPLTLDIMKLTDVRSCNLKNCGGITGRVAKLLGLVFEKTLVNPHPVFSCKHCDEEIEDGDAEDMKKHLESQHADFLANLTKVFPQASKRMDQHISKALVEYKFKPSKKVIPLTLDTMKLQDTRTQSLKNYGGIAGRIARQIGLVFKKEITTDGIEFKCVHCDEAVEDTVLKDHLENEHESFFTNLLKIFPRLKEEDKMTEHITKAASEFDFKVPTGEDQDTEEKDLIDDDDDDEKIEENVVESDADEEEDDKEEEEEEDDDESEEEKIEEVNLESDDDDDEIEEVEKVEEKTATKRKGETDKKESPKKKKVSEPEKKESPKKKKESEPEKKESPKKKVPEPKKKESPKKKKVSESEDDEDKSSENEKEQNEEDSDESETEKEENGDASKDEKEKEDIPGVNKATMQEVDDATKKRDDSMSGRLAAQLELVYSFEGEEGSMKAVCEGCGEEISTKNEVGNHIKTAHSTVYENITDILNTKEGELLPTTPASMARFFSKAASKMGIKA